MKYLKMLGPAAVATASLMVFAGSASATTATAPAGTLYTSTVSMSNSALITMHGPINFACNKSTIQQSISSHGAGVTAKGNVSTFTLSECNQHVKVISKGSLEFHAVQPSGHATVTSSGLQITAEFTTFWGDIHCVLGTNNTDIGYFVGASSNTGHAFIDIENAVIPVVSGSALCGSSVEWTGQYKITTPTGLRFD